MHFLTLIKPALLLCLSFPALAQEPVVLLYSDRPPYLVTQPDGGAAGLTGTPVARAFERAGISHVWARVPTNRQLSLIRLGKEPACAIGWFRNPEREEFARFTRPIYQDRPTVALANIRFIVPEGATLARVLPHARVLVKDRYSYGPFIDDLLARLKPALVVTTNENIQMARMIQAGRADFMFVAEEEAGYLAVQAGLGPQDFKVLDFPDMPQGEKRHLMCSMRVPKEIIARLDQALAVELTSSPGSGRRSGQAGR